LLAALAVPAAVAAHNGNGRGGQNRGGPDLNGLNQADHADTTQVNENRAPYDCLMQDDVNLTSPPLASTCTDTNPTNNQQFTSAFRNQPFSIDDYIPPTATTCPNPPSAFAPNGFLNGTGLRGGCTRDLVHRYYQEQYQLDSGKQDRYVTGSDAVGLTMGHYKTSPCRSTSTCMPAGTRTTRSPTTSSRGRSAARSSTTSG
jgi:hypothetical protein